MADDAGRHEQLEADLRQLHQRFVAAQAEVGALCEREAMLVGRAELAEAGLAEALEQQTTTAEVLRVIASSPTNLDRVLNSVAQGAMRRCETNDATIIQVVDGGCRMIWNDGTLGVAAAPAQGY